jgi:hypothetical protein
MPRIAIKHIVLTIIWLFVAGVSLYGGLEYYSLSLHDRAYSDLHDLYKPSGFFGHGLGIVGSLMMIVGVAMYSIRKRVRRFEQSGELSTWLTAHIFLCTLGPYLVTLHTAFRFGGIISIAFWSMVAVVLSGVFGRYIYVRIPKAANGQFLSEAALAARQKHLLASILEYHPIDESQVRNLLATVFGTGSGDRKTTDWIRGTYGTGSRRKKLIGQAAVFGMTGTDAKRFAQKMVDYQNLVNQSSFSGTFQRLFGYWHVFHLPLALIMMTIMLLHIGIAFTFGYFWIS